MRPRDTIGTVRNGGIFDETHQTNCVAAFGARAGVFAGCGLLRAGRGDHKRRGGKAAAYGGGRLLPRPQNGGHFKGLSGWNAGRRRTSYLRAGAHHDRPRVRRFARAHWRQRKNGGRRAGLCRHSRVGQRRAFARAGKRHRDGRGRRPDASRKAADEAGVPDASCESLRA